MNNLVEIKAMHWFRLEPKSTDWTTHVENGVKYFQNKYPNVKIFKLGFRKGCKLPFETWGELEIEFDQYVPENVVAIYGKGIFTDEQSI